MPYIQLEGQQYPLVAGENAVGSGEGVRIRLTGSGVEGVSAMLMVAADSGTIVRPAGEQPVKVNGVALGPEGAPLLHGDKLEVAGRELFFGDDQKAGNTQYVPFAKVAAMGGGPPAAARKPTAATGGRINSLVDGREYQIATGGLVIGRDPSCEVVVSSTDVSRKHASIAPGADGYTITDMSTNGVLVNGARITAPTKLGNGDVIEIGGEEFRFHADAAAAAAASAGAAAQRPVIGTLEVTSSGLLKGKKFEIRLPLVHLGRGAHNEIVIGDESVSDAHAKLQRRESGWWVVDMGSTNGTYVGGKRIAGEQQLVGAPDVRLGGVKFIFRAVDAGDPTQGGQTRAIATLRGSEPKGRTTAKQGHGAAGAPTPARSGAVETKTKTRPEGNTAPSTGGTPVVVWIIAVLALLGVGLFLITSR